MLMDRLLSLVNPAAVFTSRQGLRIRVVVSLNSQNLIKFRLECRVVWCRVLITDVAGHERKMGYIYAQVTPPLDGKALFLPSRRNYLVSFQAYAYGVGSFVMAVMYQLSKEDILSMGP